MAKRTIGDALKHVSHIAPGCVVDILECQNCESDDGHIILVNEDVTLLADEVERLRGELSIALDRSIERRRHA